MSISEPSLGDDRSRFSKYLFAAAYVLVAAASLWLRAGVPVHAIVDAYYDDGLFLRLARSISAGHWLGSFDNTTLVKGPAYPAFIAAAHLLHTPLKLAEQAVYLLAACVVARVAVHGRTENIACRLLGLATFGLLALNPVLWHPELARVIREGLYVSLSLGALALTVGACSTPPAGRPRRSLALGAALGFVLGAFWLTREEGVWLLPALAIAGAIAVLPAGRPIPGMARRQWRRRLLGASAAGLTFGLVLAVVALLNARYYGVLQINEVKSAAFRHAYGALARIRPDHWQRYVVIPEDARERAYAVSEAARALRPTLEGPMARAWEHERCVAFQIEPCTGLHAGWFQWELRSAVADAGYYRTAGVAAGFYGRLAAELDTACEDGRLDCLPPRSTLAPPFRWQYIGDTARMAPAVLGILARMGDGATDPQPSAGAFEPLQAIAAMVGPVSPPVATRWIIQGWIAAETGTPGLVVRDKSGPAAMTSVTLRAAEDVRAALPGYQAVRFRIDTACPPDSCNLVILGATGATLSVPLQQLPRSGSFGRADLTGFIDDQHLAWPRPGARNRIAHVIGRAYAGATGCLAAAACLGLGIGLIRRRYSDAPAALYAMAIGSAVAVASRVMLLSYLDVTAIPSANVLYLSPASPFLLVFIAIGIFLGLRGVFTSRAALIPGAPSSGGLQAAHPTIRRPVWGFR